MTLRKSAPQRWQQRSLDVDLVSTPLSVFVTGAGLDCIITIWMDGKIRVVLFNGIVVLA